MEKPKYKFVHPDTVLFLTGIPLSGKSTLCPLISSSIEGCTLQSMDIFRLFSQEFENRKPEKIRNPYVKFGSCDSYIHIGKGKYTPRNLIIGFNRYAEVVSSLLSVVLPKLEAQGVKNMIFEGVQLTPSIVFPYLKNNNKLIILTTNEKKIVQNRAKIFGKDPVLLERYSNEKLFLLQKEILKQSQKLPANSFYIVSNSGEYLKTANKIIDYLLNTKVIEEIN